MSKSVEDKAKVFTIGAAYGFVAGVFAMALLVWQFGDVLETRASTRSTRDVPALEEKAAAKAADAPADADTPVIESAAPAPTTGTIDPTTPSIGAPPAAELEDRDLLIPVEGISADKLTPQFNDDRGGRRHEALDILAPQGTPVRAVEDGQVARLFFSKAGGITIYQFDPSERFCYYYAHLDRYAPGLKEKDKVRRGQVIGYVGVSGNAPKNTPHLHFAVFRLNEQKRWWEGTPIDPYQILR
jgi:peptidoglycan LD-endopeptidase LytH